MAALLSTFTVLGFKNGNFRMDSARLEAKRLVEPAGVVGVILQYSVVRIPAVLAASVQASYVTVSHQLPLHHWAWCHKIRFHFGKNLPSYNMEGHTMSAAIESLLPNCFHANQMQKTVANFLFLAPWNKMLALYYSFACYHVASFTNRKWQNYQLKATNDGMRMETYKGVSGPLTATLYDKWTANNDDILIVWGDGTL